MAKKKNTPLEEDEDFPMFREQVTKEEVEEYSKRLKVKKNKLEIGGAPLCREYFFNRDLVDSDLTNLCEGSDDIEGSVWSNIKYIDEENGFSAKRGDVWCAGEKISGTKYANAAATLYGLVGASKPKASDRPKAFEILKLVAGGHPRELVEWAIDQFKKGETIKKVQDKISTGVRGKVEDIMDPKASVKQKTDTIATDTSEESKGSAKTPAPSPEASAVDTVDTGIPTGQSKQKDINSVAAETQKKVTQASEEESSSVQVPSLAIPKQVQKLATKEEVSTPATPSVPESGVGQTPTVPVAPKKSSSPAWKKAGSPVRRKPEETIRRIQGAHSAGSMWGHMPGKIIPQAESSAAATPAPAVAPKESPKTAKTPKDAEEEQKKATGGQQKPQKTARNKSVDVD
jgi:hypothetical protein